MRRVALAAVLALGTCRTPEPCSANLDTDSFNCGACGVVCDDGRRCEGARCVKTCAGLRCAGDVCVEPATDPNNCGACGVVCAPQHAAPACLAARCSHGPCETGWYDCDGLGANGCENDDARCWVDVCGRRPDGAMRFCEVAAGSADGQRVLFYSRDGTFVPDDTMFSADLFLFEVPSRTYRRVSLTTDGRPPSGATGQAAISGDGTRIGFIHSARLTPEDQDPFDDLYLLDLETGLLSMGPDVEFSDAGEFLVNDLLGISHNGMRVVRGPVFAGGRTYVQVLDVLTGERFQVFSYADAHLSADGLVIGTVSYDFGPMGSDAYVTELDGGEPHIAWERPPGYLVFNAPVFSFDGRVQALQVRRDVLAPGEDAGFDHIVVIGEDGGTRVRLEGRAPSLSYDGRRLAYEAAFRNVPDGCRVYDLERGDFIFSSLSELPGEPCRPVISGDGCSVLFVYGGLSRGALAPLP